MRRGRPSLVSFAAGFAGVLTAGLGLLSIGIEVAFTLLFSGALAGGFVVPEFAASGDVSAFSSASVAAFVSLASSLRAAAFLSRRPSGVSSSGPSATWKLIWVPKRGLKER